MPSDEVDYRPRHLIDLERAFPRIFSWMEALIPSDQDYRPRHLIDLERALPGIFAAPGLVQPPAEDDRWESEEDAQRHRARPRP